MKIKINEKQYVFLQKLTEKQSVHISVLSTNNDIIIEISEEDAEKIRDLASEYIDIYGFDENYELTNFGQLAENLIDILYI
ncbi:MAG: hypothetical protein LBB90_04560 [Tannerella sp.]|jgi:hypothetical protein|nr:hypothetical protein [Tannerella sp.]